MKQTNSGLIVYLAKANTSDFWDSLEKKKGLFGNKDEDSPALDKNKDPNQSLMEMMRDMYQNGDPEMKRMIAEAWTKSRDEQEAKSKHDHDHDHDHEGHDHDHGHQYKVAGYSLVETHTHEGATVCSFEKETSLSPKEAQAAMKEAFAEIESWLNSEGAIIGHVKGYIRTHGPSYTFSTVGSGVNTGEYEGNGASVGFASIVFGPDEETMKDKVTEIFAGLK